MKDEYVVYGKHDTECTMRYADGKPMEKLVNVLHTKDEAFFLASHLSDSRRQHSPVNGEVIEGDVEIRDA